MDWIACVQFDSKLLDVMERLPGQLPYDIDRYYLLLLFVVGRRQKWKHRAIYKINNGK